MMVSFYDVYVAIPLRIESMMRWRPNVEGGRKTSSRARVHAPTGSAV